MAWALAGLAMLALVPVLRLVQLLRASGLPDFQAPSATALPVILATVSAAIVGAVLAGRRPATRWAGCSSASAYSR